MHKIKAFEQDFKINFEAGFGNYTAANIDTTTNDIIVFSIVPPSEFIQVVAHEIQHAINSSRYCQFWGIILDIDKLDIGTVMKLLDEQAAMASEDAITLYINHKKELNLILKDYKKFHKDNQVEIEEDKVGIILEKTISTPGYNIKKSWLTS